MRNARGRVLNLVYRMRQDFASAWRQTGGGRQPCQLAREARKLMDEKPIGSSLAVRGLKDVRRQGTETLTEQLADRIAAPEGSLRATVGTQQVSSF
jgi:hypothetical protein